MWHLNSTLLELYYCRFPSFTNRGWGCHKRKVPNCSVTEDFLFHLLHSLEEFQGNFPLHLQRETCECDLECVVLWHSCDLRQSESCETETSRESHFSPDKEIPLIFACLAHRVTFWKHKYLVLFGSASDFSTTSLCYWTKQSSSFLLKFKATSKWEYTESYRSSVRGMKWGNAQGRVLVNTGCGPILSIYMPN